MSFQIYNNASLRLQVIDSGSVIMDPGGLFVASNWAGSTNIHPLSSSADIYRNNGPIGENYHGIVGVGNSAVNFRPAGGNAGALLTGFDVNNTGSNAGLTHSWWMKTFSTSDHWDGSFIATLAGGTANYYSFIPGWYGSGGIIGTIAGVAFPTDNDWHHFVVTYDSGSQKAYTYIDGDLKNTTGAFTVTTNHTLITFATFNGAVDEWAFCHKFLQPSDFAPFGKPINLMKKKDELRLKAYIKFGDGIEQGSGSNCHSLLDGAGTFSTGSFHVNLGSGANIGSASANLLKNSGKVVDFNV